MWHIATMIRAQLAELAEAAHAVSLFLAFFDRHRRALSSIIQYTIMGTYAVVIHVQKILRDCCLIPRALHRSTFTFCTARIFPEAPAF